MTKYEELITQSDEQIEKENLSFNLEQSKLNMSTGINQMKGKVLKAETNLSRVIAKGGAATQALNKARRKQPLCPQALIDAQGLMLDHEVEVKDAKDKVDYAKSMLDFLQKEEKELFAVLPKG